MKKKILFAGMVLAVMGVTAFHFNRKDKGFESLMLENMEALAAGEVGETVRCIGYGSVDCPLGHIKVYLVSFY